MIDPKTLFNKLNRADPAFYTPTVCEDLAHKLNRINELKRQRNAVLLAHNYQRPEVFEVADFVGDSLDLSLHAGEVGDADVIIFCGVHFMAETAKIVNPSKKVILPNIHAGCSLADTADAEDVEQRIEELRRQDPDLAVICYVNTTAAVKALCDSCCTSSNAVQIIRALPQKNILFLPDRNLATYVAKIVPEKNIIAWNGFCYVHQELQPDSILKVREAYPGLKVLVHPECRDDVVALADAVMSTSGMVNYARESTAHQFLAVTECGLSDLLNINVPDKQFFRACKVCRFMKMITLENIINSLERLEPEIIIPEDVRKKAERSIRRMFKLTSPKVKPPVLV